MSAADLLDDGFPHGTLDGYREGCRGSHCAAPIACRDVYRRYSGDAEFRRLIDSGNTLNVKIAREADDERHLTPLQLDFIDRCVRLWSNPGELVFSAFAGVGSEVYEAVKLGRRALGIELKASYWSTGVGYLRDLETDLAAPRITDHLDIS